jgi:hypothetical protein
MICLSPLRGGRLIRPFPHPFSIVPLPGCNSVVIGARYHHYDEVYKEKDKSWTGSNKAKK